MQEREDQHSKLSDKYLGDAEVLLKEGDYVQASEKFWGAAALMVKTVAAGRGMEIGSHREIRTFVNSLRNERGEPELSLLFSVAADLHRNFYEDWLPPETVADYSQAAKEFIRRLQGGG
ncbi:MAG: PaREP1 family protein [Dehalococcoidia bacterium]|nr:PaREP1 family protein [Dehalococcoidia bacterium]